MSHEAAVLLIALPLLGAFLLPTLGRIHAMAAYWAAPLVVAMLPAIALELWDLHNVGALLPVAVGGFAAPVGIVLYPDRLALTFVIVLAFATLVLWPKLEREGVRKSALVLLLVAGGNGLALAGDLFNAFVFYEIVAVACYGLAAERATGAGYAAALRLLILSALGSALALLGIALIYTATGTLNFAHLAVNAAALNTPMGLAAFALLVVGFGVKAELFPVNTWVPEVYGATSGRIAGLLAGVVSKLALLLLLRVLTLVYADSAAVWLLLTVGILGMVSGELAAYRAADLRRTLAYSSIGQLGVVAAALALPGEAGLAAALALALHHLVIKPGLFLFADAWHGRDLDGAARRSPWAGVLFLLFALSLIGVPPLPGFWAKLLFLKEAIAAGGPFALAAAVMLVATVIETVYLFRFIRRAYGSAGSHGVEGLGPDEGIRATAFGAALVLAMLLVTPLSGMLGEAAADAADVQGYVSNVFGAQAEVTP